MGLAFFYIYNSERLLSTMSLSLITEICFLTSFTDILKQCMHQEKEQNKQNKTKWKYKTVLLWAWVRAQLVKGHASMTLALIPRTPVRKSHAWRCWLRIPVLGRGRQRDPWASQQTTLLGDLQARDFLTLVSKIKVECVQRLTFEVGDLWPPHMYPRVGTDT